MFTVVECLVSSTMRFYILYISDHPSHPSCPHFYNPIPFGCAPASVKPNILHQRCVVVFFYQPSLSSVLCFGVCCVSILSLEVAGRADEGVTSLTESRSIRGPQSSEKILLHFQTPGPVVATEPGSSPDPLDVFLLETITTEFLVHSSLRVCTIFIHAYTRVFD